MLRLWACCLLLSAGCAEGSEETAVTDDGAADLSVESTPDPPDVPLPDPPDPGPATPDVETADVGSDLPPEDTAEALDADPDPIEEVLAEDTLEPEDTPEQDTEVVEEPDVPEVVEPPPPLWLLSIDNGTHMLQKVDVLTGATTDLCKLTTTFSYPSLTFNRNNVLYASRSGTFLDTIDPCTCEVEPVGTYGGFGGVNGITSDQTVNLFGVASNEDELISILGTKGIASTVGALGVNFGTGGAAWSDTLGALYAINGNDDSLYTVDTMTGVATLVTPLSKSFGTVGIELHPANDVIYACTSDAVLRSIDPVTGTVTEIGPMDQKSSCTNLAAPWKPIPCL